MTRFVLPFYAREPRLFLGLSIAAAMMLGLYGYFTVETVFATAKRRDLEHSVSALRSEVGELDFAYIGKRSAVSRDTALALGFADEPEPLYVRRQASTLSFNNR